MSLRPFRNQEGTKFDLANRKCTWHFHAYVSYFMYPNLNTIAVLSFCLEHCIQEKKKKNGKSGMFQTISSVKIFMKNVYGYYFFRPRMRGKTGSL